MKAAFSLIGKNIVITGASSGIGRQCAITASQYGANIALIARSKEKLEETCNNLKKGKHLTIAQDLTEYQQLEGVVSQIYEKMGRISGFVYSAGMEMTLPLKSLRPIHYEKVFSLNVVSAFELARIISSKKFLDENGASFIFVASVMGILGEAGKIGYCASKGALVSGSKAMALELASKKVRVNSILPAIVETEMSAKLFQALSEESKTSIINMHPLGLGKPEDVANACVFLLSDASRWITGTNLIVDGGYCAR